MKGGRKQDGADGNVKFKCRSNKVWINHAGSSQANMSHNEPNSGSSYPCPVQSPGVDSH